MFTVIAPVISTISRLPLITPLEGHTKRPINFDRCQHDDDKQTLRHKKACNQQDRVSEMISEQLRKSRSPWVEKRREMTDEKTFSAPKSLCRVPSSHSGARQRKPSIGYKVIPSRISAATNVTAIRDKNSRFKNSIRAWRRPPVSSQWRRSCHCVASATLSPPFH